VKNDFTGYFIYDLPFGHGQKYGGDINKVVNGLVGDWRVSVIPTFRGGFPLTLGDNDVSGTNSFGPRPNCSGPPIYSKQFVPATASTGAYIQWFSAAPYSEPASGFGNCSIGSVYGPGESNIDLGLSKSFPVTEHQNIEFRTEFLNAFNHPILNAPITSIGSTLGQINSSQGSQGARNIQFALKYNF
jgi:hypothetical protein